MKNPKVPAKNWWPIPNLVLYDNFKTDMLAAIWTLYKKTFGVWSTAFYFYISPDGVSIQSKQQDVVLFSSKFIYKI